MLGEIDIPFSADPILISGSIFIGTTDSAAVSAAISGSTGATISGAVDDGMTAAVTFAPGQQFISQSATGIVDLLVVSAGSTLNAVGTATAPIIFTSFQDFEDDGLPNGTSGVGDWGGIAINGLAPLNECTVDSTAAPGTAECQQSGEGGSGIFGGDVVDDSSGDFQFIRVQHAGFLFNGEDELNGVALQGVGNGTTFENIQVHMGNDDGFEWFGGTVNAKNLVVTGPKTTPWIGPMVGRVTSSSRSLFRTRAMTMVSRATITVPTAFRALLI